MTARTRSGRPVGNLPGEATSFVGRRRETARAARLLRRARLLTLTGVAGVGKTRLALRVAAQVREAFPDGVWLVELAALTDGRLLAPTLADVLGIQNRRHGPAVETLAGHLRDKQLLLVLDNCEHLLDSCAMLTSQLLAAAPGLRILATSRQALGMAGEYLLEVPPLPVPDPEQPTTPRTIARGEAVLLFAERAAVARPGFTVDASNRAMIARICQRLDGIPLAIELAALRVRALSVTEILAGLRPDGEERARCGDFVPERGKQPCEENPAGTVPTMNGPLRPPTDPRELYEWLAQNSATHADPPLQFFRTASIILDAHYPADLRRATLQALSYHPYLVIADASTKNGRPAISIGIDYGAGNLREDVLLDPVNGQLIGRRTVCLKDVNGAKAGDIIRDEVRHQAVVNKLGDDPTN